jgi:hypothetical protein
MNQPFASESVLSDESHWEFVPVIQVKAGAVRAGVAVRRKQLRASPALPSDWPELGPREDLARAASGKARPVRINLLSSQFRQQDFAP